MTFPDVWCLPVAEQKERGGEAKTQHNYNKKIFFKAINSTQQMKSPRKSCTFLYTNLVLLPSNLNPETNSNALPLIMLTITRLTHSKYQRHAKHSILPVPEKSLVCINHSTYNCIMEKRASTRPLGYSDSS